MAICNTSPAVGSRAAIYIGQEECWGNFVRPTHQLDFNSEGLAATENTITSEGIRADRAIHKLIVGNRDVGGDLTSEFSAKGFGMLTYNALGNYLKLEDSSVAGGAAEGGKHARMEAVAYTMADAAGGGSHDLDLDTVIELSKETCVDFDTGAGVHRMALVYKLGLSKTLTFEDNVGAGFTYGSFGGREVSSILSIGAPAADPLHGVAASTPITLKQVLDSTGVAIDPDVNLNGGFCYVGQNRVRLPYLSAVKTGSGTTLYLQPSTLTASGITPSVNDTVIVAPSLALGSSEAGLLPAAVKKGSWIFQWYPGGGAVDYSDVRSHFFEAGERLPEGLTIETNRDAAYFLYSGMKVSTMGLEFASNAIVQSTFSLLGKREYAIGILEADVVPGAVSILVSKAEHFPDPQLFPVAEQEALISIGEERDIIYTTLTDNLDGTVTLGGIPSTGDGSISRHHLKKDNVDLRTSLTNENIVANPVYRSNQSPLTSFESLLCLDGYFEEVLSASVNINNNLNGDKFGLGQRERFGIVEEQRTVDGSLNVEFDDGKLYKKFQEGEFFSQEFRCVSEADDSEIGSSDIFHQVYVFLPKCKFNGTTPNVADTSYIQVDMPFSAIYDDDYDTAEVVIIMVNDGDQDVVY